MFRNNDDSHKIFRNMGSWRDGSAVRNAYCSYTAPGSDPSIHTTAHNCL